MSVGKNAGINFVGAVLPMLAGLLTVPPYLHRIGRLATAY